MQQIITIKTAKDILELLDGAYITKRNLREVIQDSRCKDTTSWAGSEYKIGNSYQNGINWIGIMPNLKGVIIKSNHCTYGQDGWISESLYSYAFQARNNSLNKNITANLALRQQPEYNYPILLFEGSNNLWHFRGYFSLKEEKNTSVILQKQI